MPLVRITLADGKTAEYRRAIADGVHHALVAAATVPADDRFQVVEQVPADASSGTPPTSDRSGRRTSCSSRSS